MVQFHDAVKSAYGSYTGKEIADAALRSLKSSGISPEELASPTDANGHNTQFFTTQDGLAVKVVNELEHHQTLADGDRAVVKRLSSENIGFDMGGTAISLAIVPLMNTKGVTDQHVQALCHELHTRGKLFRDNKKENVALTRNGTPYVIDEGAVVPTNSLSPLERSKPYLYPELSGFDANNQTWSPAATQHSFQWPEHQRDVTEFKEAAARLQERKGRIATNVQVIG